MSNKLIGTDLEKVLYNALPQHTDGQGKSLPIPDQLKKYAKGIVAALQAAKVANAPNTITGVTAVGAPLTAGTGAGGTITISPDIMVSITKLNPPVPMYEAENKAIISYIGTGLVVFGSGSIAGQCTNTPLAPGPLVAGSGVNGKITGLTDKGAIAAVEGALGGKIGPDMEPFYAALVSYILQTALVTYAANSITGVCPTGGGPLTGGTGVGGTIA